MNKDELLYLYFSNSLTKSQEQQFKELLDNDAEFKAQFDFENNLKQVIKAEKSDALKDKLKGFEMDLSKTEDKSWFNWRIAASIVLLLGASWFGYESLFGLDYNSLYDDNYTNYPNTVYTITRSDENNSLQREAFVAYETGDFKLALEKFKSIKEEEPYFNFYKAQSYLGLDNLDEAKALFEKELLSDSQFKAEALWYLALINLKQKNKTEATGHLKDLITSHNYKKEEAKTLLNALN